MQILYISIHDPMIILDCMLKIYFFLIQFFTLTNCIYKFYMYTIDYGFVSGDPFPEGTVGFGELFPRGTVISGEVAFGVVNP